MNSRLSYSEGSHFAWDSMLLIASGALSGFLFFLVHVVLGRAMNSCDYAVLVSLIGLLNILGLPAGTIQVVMARYVAEYSHKNETALWVTVVKRAARRITYWGMIALALWCLGSGLLRKELNAPSVASLIVLGVTAFLTLFSPIMQGTLQGSRQFGWMAASGIGTAVSRIVFVAIAAFVFLRSSVTPALGAFAASAAAGLLIAYWPVRRVLADTPQLENLDTRPMYGYLWPVFLGQFALLLLVNIDLTLSAKFLGGDDLAAYGKAAMLSRTVLFLPQPVALAMFPRAVTSANPRLIYGPLLFTLLVSLAAASFISVFPGIPMRLIYNVNSPIYLHLTRLYAWAVIPLSLVMILSQYLWARHKTREALILVPPVLLYILMLALRHESPEQMILCLAVGGLMSLLGFVFVIVVSGKRKNGAVDSATQDK